VAEFVAALEIHLKPGALDPQGQAVAAALRALGRSEVAEVRVGKHVLIRLRADDEQAARSAAEAMAAELLANPVMETCAVDIRPAARGADPCAQP